MNTEKLSLEEQGRLRTMMDGRDYICVSLGERNRAFCNMSMGLGADRKRAASLLRRAADLLDGKHPDRIRPADVLPDEDE